MEYIVFAVLGILSGLGFYHLSCYQIKVRSIHDIENKGAAIKKPFFKYYFMFVPMVLFMMVAWLHMDYWQSIRYCLIILMAISLAAVDGLIRRIPNATLLGMLILQIVNIVVTTYGQGNTLDKLFESMFAMVIAYVVFVAPGFVKLQVGAGDIKYSAVIGFMMSFAGYFQVMIVMAIGVLAYYLYLKIAKRGNLKTAAPMAPFLSGGVIITLFFPLIY